jgi:hypothetical protein
MYLIDSIDLTIDNIIHSKGPIKNSYSKKHTEIASTSKEIINIINSITKDKNIIFVRNGSSEKIHDLDILACHLDLIKYPVILITTDGDRPSPSSYDFNKTVNPLLKSDMIIKWYTQNYDKSIIHDKLTYMPIGFDLHTSAWLIKNSISEKINYMINARISSITEKRISNLIFCDAHNSISHPERKIMHNILINNKKITFCKNILPFYDITRVYNKYNFVISPRGNGVDCHRTWELFLAGVIVITRTSSIDNIYINNNLPVVILQNWDELNNDIENKLKKWYDDHIHKTSLDNIIPRLTFDYWLNI